MEVARQLKQSCHDYQHCHSDWFEMFLFSNRLLLYQKSTILRLSFLDPKDLCLPKQFLRGSNNFRNSSYKEKTASSARFSRLSFRFL